MKIVSYYTKNTPYEQVANEFLIPSVQKWGLDYDIKAIDDFGNWQLNTGYKSKFIKEMLLKHKEPVVFLDCDASIVIYPELLYNIPKDIDLGFFHFNWFGHWRGQWENTSKIELLSGTMYWDYNEKVLKLIDEWISKIDENVNRWEQKVLEEIVFARTDLNIYKLPAEYCCVLMQNNTIPKYINDPVIIHHQASRLYRNWRRK
jgi:hypothetical protein